MKNTFELWAAGLSYELQTTMLLLRDKMTPEVKKEDLAKYPQASNFIKELEDLCLVKITDNKIQFTTTGAEVVNYCTC